MSLLTKNYTSTNSITYHRFVKADGVNVAQAAAATDAILGVCETNGTTASGKRVDVALMGEVEIELGGTVATGAPATADSNGKAVAAAAGSAGTTVRVAGIMTLGGVAGDIGRILLAPSTIVTPA